MKNCGNYAYTFSVVAAGNYSVNRTILQILIVKIEEKGNQSRNLIYRHSTLRNSQVITIHQYNRKTRSSVRILKPTSNLQVKQRLIIEYVMIAFFLNFKFLTLRIETVDQFTWYWTWKAKYLIPLLRQQEKNGNKQA